jgi:hypothetical protein
MSWFTEERATIVRYWSAENDFGRLLIWRFCTIEHREVVRLFSPDRARSPRRQRRKGRLSLYVAAVLCRKYSDSKLRDDRIA